jgi:hypothetical protein
LKRSQISTGASGARPTPPITIGVRAAAWAAALAARYLSRDASGHPADLFLHRPLAPPTLTTVVRLRLTIDPHIHLLVSRGPAIPARASTTAPPTVLPVRLMPGAAPADGSAMTPFLTRPALLVPPALLAAAQAEQQLGSRAERVVSAAAMRSERPMVARPPTLPAVPEAPMVLPHMRHTGPARHAGHAVQAESAEELRTAALEHPRTESLAAASERSRAETSAAAPVDLDRLTEQVIRGIDRRIVARRERLGRA